MAPLNSISLTYTYTQTHIYTLTHITMKDEITLKLSPNTIGDTMTYEDFTDMYKTGTISNQDGHGYFGNETHHIPIMFNASELTNRQTIATLRMTHILWCNK